MNVFKHKKLTTTITLLLMLTLTAITMFPPTNAATNESYYYSYIYCSVSNSKIGIGQTQLIVTWTADMPPDIGEQTSAQGRASWSNLVVTVTDPDGANTTLNIPATDAIGGGYVNYVPEKLGTYTVQVYMPKQVKVYPAAQNLTAYYTEARSPPLTFVAQTEPVQGWTESPLPDGYWSRPINQASREWYVLGGNWLSGAHEQPAGEAGGTTTRYVGGLATETAHVLWAKPRYEGGGYMEEGFTEGFQTGHYQGLDWSAIVVNGKIYYPYRDTAHSSQGFLVVDLYTGKTLEYVNQTMPSFGQIYNYDSGNQHGGFAYLYRISGITLPLTV